MRHLAEIDDGGCLWQVFDHMERRRAGKAVARLDLSRAGRGQHRQNFRRGRARRVDLDALAACSLKRLGRLF